MRTPSIVPTSDDCEVYLVLDDFGRLGRAWRETDDEQADRETIISNLLTGEYSRPVRVIAFNSAERWSRDVSEEIADEVSARMIEEDWEMTAALKDFLDRHANEMPDQLSLPLRAA